MTITNNLFSEIIPQNRRITWNPGIPGGIPKRTTIFANVKDAPYKAKGDGTNDDSEAIQKAINDCPEGQVVYIPKGNYRLRSPLTIEFKGIVLRGDGPSKTILKSDLPKSSSDKYAITIGSDLWLSPIVNMNSGYNKGSSSIKVSNASEIEVGQYLILDQLNDPNLVNKNGNEGACGFCSRKNGTRAMGQMVEVTSVQGNTINFIPPLYYGFSSKFKPQAAISFTQVTKQVGLEDFKITVVKGSHAIRNIMMMGSAYCWIKNIESYKAYGAHIWTHQTFKCEFRDSFIHEGHVKFEPSAAYGILLGTVCTDNLIENNILNELLTAIQLNWGACGNVIGYNYIDNSFGSAQNHLSADLNLNHGAHPFMNLVEGNIFDHLVSDIIHGSSSHNTVFRNYSRGSREGKTGALRAVSIAAWNRYVNIVGNVLGTPGLSTIYEHEGEPSPYSNSPLIYRLGYWECCTGTSSKKDDSQVKSTLLRHGNFDYATKGVIWDKTISDRKLPKSYYLNSKPSFFGKLSWPPIGPDQNPKVGLLPAQVRFQGGNPEKPKKPNPPTKLTIE